MKSGKLSRKIITELETITYYNMSELLVIKCITLFDKKFPIFIK
jgi:hypothetical protein